MTVLRSRFLLLFFSMFLILGGWVQGAYTQEAEPGRGGAVEANLFRQKGVSEEGKKTAEFLKVLEKRKQELDEREGAIRGEEERLKLLQQDLQEMLKQSIQAREGLEKLKTKPEAAEETLGLLIKVYEIMPPEEAAVRIAKMDERVVLGLMTRMKGRSVAKILSFVEPSKAARISEKLAKKTRLVKD